MPKLTLYGRPGCHLCEEALAEIELVRLERPFELQQVDVSRDPLLDRRYGERVPVLELDGEPVFELFVDGDELRRLVGKVAP